MRKLRILLPLLALLIGSAAASAQGQEGAVTRSEFNPVSPEEPSTPKEKGILYIKVNPAAGGTVNRESGTKYDAGQTVSLSTSASSGYRFVNWTRDDVEVSTSTSFSYTIEAGEQTLVANYVFNPSSPGEPEAPVLKHRLTLQTNLPNATSSLYGAGSYDTGETVRVYGYANKYYTFVNWTDEDGTTVSETFDFRYTLPDRDVTLTANFTYDFKPADPEEPGAPVFSRKLTLRADPEGGASSLYGGGNYASGESVRVYGYANSYYTFINWTDDEGEVVSETFDFRYTMPERNVTLTAHFSYGFNPESPREPESSDIPESLYVARPRISLQDEEHVMMLCETIGATIHYTLDDSTPTFESTVYGGPVELPGNVTVKAIATKDGLIDSPVGTLEVTHFILAVPTATYADRHLVMESETPGATFRYTMDGTDPTPESTLYTGPIPLSEDCTVRFIAQKQKYVDSEIGIYEFKVSGHQVATPVLTYDPESLTVTVTCETPNAEIRYTIDGEAPTEDTGIKYEGAVAVVGNHTYTARAFRSDIFDSEAAFVVVDDQRVPTPTANFSNRVLTLSCADAAAHIRYSIGGEDPTSESTLYEAPVALTEDCTIRFIAQREFFIDSEISTFEFKYADYMTVPATAAYGRQHLTLSCEDASADIRYSIGDDPLTEESPLYEAPIPLTESCTVNFMAVAPGLFPSEPGSHVFSMEDWQETGASFATYYDLRKIIVSHADGLPVRIDIDGEEETLDTPCTVNLSPGMSLLSVTVPASTEDRYDSEPVTSELVFHSKPELTYDGHAVHISQGDGEPKADRAEAWVFLNGTPLMQGGSGTEAKVEGFGRIEVCMKSYDAFRSDTASMTIDFYNTGKYVGVREGHRIEETFGKWGDSTDDYTYLGLTGSINADDLRFAASLPALRALRLDDGCLEDGDYGGVLQESGIETVSSFSFPEGLLKGMPRLTNVMTESERSVLSAQLSEEAGNPNLLFWIRNKRWLPDDDTNYVSFGLTDGVDPVDPDSEGISGHATRISLQAGHPFGVHREVQADRIEVVKEFTQTTQLYVCQGWETITLPFTPDSVTHEREGRIVPFAAWDGDIKGLRPFWLYSPTTRSWKAEERIEALKPYIIQMPNSPDYVDAFNLNGKVTFTASGITLDPGAMTPEASEWKGGTALVGSLMPVGEDGIRSLNVNGEGGYLPGSCFVDEGSTGPFGAYVRGAGAARVIQVFGGQGGLDVPVIEAGGITVETPAPGTIRICSMSDRRVDVTTPEGVRLRSLTVAAGEEASVDGLPRGLYIAAGVKVMVR